MCRNKPKTSIAPVSVIPGAILKIWIRNKTRVFWGPSVTVVFGWDMAVVEVGLYFARNIEKHQHLTFLEFGNGRLYSTHKLRSA